MILMYDHHTRAMSLSAAAQLIAPPTTASEISLYADMRSASSLRSRIQQRPDTLTCGSRQCPVRQKKQLKRFPQTPLWAPTVPLSETFWVLFPATSDLFGIENSAPGHPDIRVQMSCKKRQAIKETCGLSCWGPLRRCRGHS